MLLRSMFLAVAIMKRFEEILDDDLKIRQESPKNNNTTKSEKRESRIRIQRIFNTSGRGRQFLPIQRRKTRQAPRKILVCCEE